MRQISPPSVQYDLNGRLVRKTEKDELKDESNLVRQKPGVEIQQLIEQ